MIVDLVLPDTEDPETAPFWNATKAGKLIMQSCDHCGEKRFPPTPFCGRCRGSSTTWVPLSGRGRIWSYVVIHPPVLPAYEPFAPFPVVVITLDEGEHLRMVGNLVAGRNSAINSVDVGNLEIGAPVEVVFQDVAPDVTLPRWRLLENIGSTS